jgi:uncharacterized surface protein with fasciclin (FAS1) repeats
MKFPQIPAYLMLLCAVGSFAQTKVLTTLPTGIYFENSEPSIKVALNADPDHHKVLFDAFKAADMESLLELSGPFTVFAPTNNAFAKLSPHERKELFKDENRGKLKKVLSYHIVAGNLTASKILLALCRGKGKASFTTVQGAKIFATIDGTDIILTDGSGKQAKITAADSNQSNGVIHQIDGVISPFGI